MKTQSQPIAAGEAAHRKPRILFTRDSLCLSFFEVRVESPGRKLLLRLHGTPLQLACVLPAIRYAVRKMHGPQLRSYLVVLRDGFWTWKARAALKSATS